MVATLEEITRAIVPELAKGGARLAILFGSYARGEADEASDVDLIVVAETDRPFIERFKDFRGVWRTSPVRSIDMFVYTPDEFESMRQDKGSPVSATVEEGVVIYEAGSGGTGGALDAPGKKRSTRR